jgi:hypothetical protein
MPACLPACSLAQHSAANFAVQAAISALRKPQQLKRMLEDLRPSFQQLLRSRRRRVVPGGRASGLRAVEARVEELGCWAQQRHPE